MTEVQLLNLLMVQGVLYLEASELRLSIVCRYTFTLKLNLLIEIDIETLNTYLA